MPVNKEKVMAEITPTMEMFSTTVKVIRDVRWVRILKK